MLFVVTDKTCRYKEQSAMQKRMLHSLTFHLYTLWLLTVSDHKPLVYPMSMTGVLNMLAGPILNTQKFPTPSMQSILRRSLITVFWVWLNFIVFCVGNQRLPKAIAEDAINKPWRPLPSKRLTELQAKLLHVGTHLAALALSTQVGAAKHTMVLMILGRAYNEYDGGSDFILRNLINALAVVCFALGATTVAYGKTAFVVNPAAWKWHAFIALIVFSTLQVQDLCDQEGDKVRGRRTLPIILGNMPSRCTVILPMAFWSLYSPWFWDLPVYGFVGPVVSGLTVCCRLLLLDGAESDRTTYKLWGLWITSLLALPIVKGLPDLVG